MAGMRLFTGNRLENLAEQLAEVLSTPLPSPLDPELIVVQSKGMERWLSMTLARHHSICANTRFFFPNAFIGDLFQKVLGVVPEASPFDRDILTWRIMKRLPALLHKPGFESLRNYLVGTPGDLKRYQLSERIADTFDQYLLFRPEMIHRWEAGRGRHWQAVLWRDLVGEHRGGHRASLARDFHRVMGQASLPEVNLPRRVSVFGISSLPGFHVGILAGLSGFTEVNLFLMNPCREYWGDILSPREMKKKAAGTGEPYQIAEEALHFEKGNSLLASMGTLGRDFFELVTDLGLEEWASFEDPGDETLLASIQSDILNLREREGTEGGRTALSPADGTIRIHSCHSPMREMEVLRDQLLDMFEKNGTLKPEDILVMTPDIETYAPYIQAVFDLAPDDVRRIHFTIADRSIRDESTVIGPLLAILDLPGSRFGASTVLDILESSPVRRKFGISETDLDLIRRWVDEAGIRWGINSRTRGELGLPASSENTWEAGLERLLLGYALPGRDEEMFKGILPYDAVGGSEAPILGGFLDFTKALFTRAGALGRNRTLQDWSEDLIGVLDEFFAADEETERETQAVRGILSDLQAVAAPGLFGFDESVSIRVIKSHLGHAFKSEGFGSGFISGGITFCAMLPMRSIPFKVICLVGMDNDTYPRQAKAPGFDLVAKRPRPGDRSRRNDDRYLFLEALLSARETFYISYVGQDIRDNTVIPPSVLVGELLEYIEQGFRVPGQGIRDHLVTTHRLQAFSPAYFRSGDRLFSYSEENLQVARCLAEGRRDREPFISGGLSDPVESWKRVGVEDLISFFRHPAKYLLNRRLGIYLDEGITILDEREPFDLKGLDRYQLEQELLERRLEGHDLRELLATVRASGRLPHGTVGTCVYENLVRGVDAFAERIRPHVEKPVLEALEVDLSLSGFRVTGRIEGIFPEGPIHYRYARIKGKDFLVAWIRHLVLNAVMGDQGPRIGMLAGLDPDTRVDPQWKAWRFDPAENSPEILEQLLKTYWEGLVRPIHFFPESSWTLARERLEKKRTGTDALNRARNLWQGDDYNRGEREDPYYQLCFRNMEPIDEAFQDLAIRIFGDLLKRARTMA